MDAYLRANCKYEQRLGGGVVALVSTLLANDAFFKGPRRTLCVFSMRQFGVGLNY